MIRAVIDTNVLVSGMLSPAGNESLILLAIHQGLIQPCFSTEMLEEYAGVLARPKFGFAADEIGALLSMLYAMGEHFRGDDAKPVLPDPDDAMFLLCARAAGAEFIVTGNKRHFPPAVCDPISVVTAGELLDRITLEI